MNLGMTELLLILGIVLLLFGPSKLPGLGKSLGEAIRGFKKGLNETDEKPATQIQHETQKDAMASSVKEKEKQS
ncbi:MAG: twin-arginine translocase TatA/TatE family subunit [Proteobacteria bacterium]|jgi:sec-independent protein translocase protein TatA|nr:twin-arginine translocase TatA/TatE family subunit [Pseudomonadota bacterium]